VTEHPGDFARGLFHSDGCRSINRVRRTRAGRDHWYEYPRYLFDNQSTDILRLCGEALDRLGVEWRFSKPTTISVARRVRDLAAAVLPDPRAKRRRRPAEPDLEFRAFCTRRRLPASPAPQLERAWDARQAERYQRGEISQRPGYAGNPFRPR